jgi:hypothetical protein
MMTSMIRLESTPYEYRRKLPHYQKFDRPLFVTFCKRTQEPVGCGPIPGAGALPRRK